MKIYMVEPNNYTYDTANPEKTGCFLTETDNNDVDVGLVVEKEGLYYEVVCVTCDKKLCFVKGLNEGLDLDEDASVFGAETVTCPCCCEKLDPLDFNGEDCICTRCGAILSFEKKIVYDTVVKKLPKIIKLEIENNE